MQPLCVCVECVMTTKKGRGCFFDWGGRLNQDQTMFFAPCLWSGRLLRILRQRRLEMQCACSTAQYKTDSVKNLHWGFFSPPGSHNFQSGRTIASITKWRWRRRRWRRRRRRRKKKNLNARWRQEESQPNEKGPFQAFLRFLCQNLLDWLFFWMDRLGCCCCCCYYCCCYCCCCCCCSILSSPAAANPHLHHLIWHDIKMGEEDQRRRRKEYKNSGCWLEVAVDIHCSVCRKLIGWNFFFWGTHGTRKKFESRKIQWK